MRRDERSGDDWQEIRADLRSLQQLTDQFSGEVSVNLRPAVLQLFDQYQLGGGFGVRSPSVDVHAVRSKYSDCLRETVDRLAKYVMESERLVDVATVILTRYQTADALASASIDDIRQAFVAADADRQRRR